MFIFIQRIIAFLTAIFSMLTSLVGAENIFDKKVDNFRVTTYVRAPYVQQKSSLYAEDFDIITDVILFECASFDSEGRVNLETEILENALGNLREVIGDRDVNITLNLIGPWGTGTSEVWEDQMESQSDAHNKAFTNDAFIDNILAVLDKYDFDGVHFDYEYPISLKAWFYYNNFLISLDRRLGDYTLGVATNEWNLKFSTAALKAVDTLEFMMYDMLDNEGKHATAENIEELMKKAGLSGIPSEKINLGLPFYSRPSDLSGYWYGYNGCYGEIDENGWYYDESIDKHFWFNTPEVVAKKTAFAVDNGYGGVMIWHYNCDLPSSHEDSLLKAVGDVVNEYYN